ncbi:DNA-binding protein [Mesorhizobium sp. SARCC-RB16n]|uniref:helix-turn-helix domain-containing protein n=1 Tax=Mesorhizobium sp. SARCC-RB16n TaxID=2116687 RepID=UPI00122F9245|nr:helix-turn-helix domain-containing protein [Mesorhizobium sp. SARCC-RB16n]KAA3447129.1 DNA-binding protein [Mesorhizobium sp. SARCC-RB16n]
MKTDASTLLTQEEVAERLRCSVAKVKRLRFTGQLAYLPGRPVLIEEADLEKYLEGIKRQAKPIATKPEKSAKPALEDPAVLAKRIFWARQNFQFDKQRKAKGK